MQTSSIILPHRFEELHHADGSCASWKLDNVAHVLTDCVFLRVCVRVCVCVCVCMCVQDEDARRWWHGGGMHLFLRRSLNSSDSWCMGAATSMRVD